jgi:hypothetical protein
MQTSKELSDAIAVIDSALRAPGRFTNSARAFAAYFLEDDPGRPLSDCPALADATDLYLGLLMSLGRAAPSDARTCLRNVLGAARIREHRIADARWSPVREELHRALMARIDKETA